MAAWTKSEVRRVIVDAIAPTVNDAGFRYKKASEAFVRKIDGGRQELGLPLYDYNPVFAFSLTLCTRLEAVQDIVNRFSGALPKYHSTTLTSITQLEFLGITPRSGQSVRFEMQSEAELAAVLPGVLELMAERVLPFFEEYRDLASLNRGLNPAGAEIAASGTSGYDRQAFDTTNQPYRAMTGVAVACLAQDLRLSALIGAYRAQIAELPDSERAKFERLASELIQRNNL
jgi:hypothetical protein